MEHWGTNQNYVQSAIHTPSSFGGTVNLGGQSIPTASTEFHDYTFVWTPDKLVFSVDGNIHYTYNPLVKDNTTWPFDADQYLLLNVAIQSVIDPTFTQSAMEIDYVRVYQESPVATEKVDNGLSPVYYPNPVDGKLNISVGNTDAQSVLLKIYNLDGTLIRTSIQSVNSQTVTLDNLDGLASGMYMVVFELNNKYYSVKFIKS